MALKQAAPLRWTKRLALAGAFALSGMAARPAAHGQSARHESVEAYCARVRNDDTLRTPPTSLVPAIRRAFNLPGGSFARKTTYYRCASGAVEACWIGANLPCGKANTEKQLPAAARWCEDHANSSFIPMYVTGHDTLYSWRCAGGRAQAGAPVGKLDARGFFAEYWKPLN